MGNHAAKLTGLRAKTQSGELALSLKSRLFAFVVLAVSLVSSLIVPCWTMRTKVRAAIAIALVATVLLVKAHLDSISQWQDSGDRKKASSRDFYVLEDGDAYIELVSAATTTPSHNPTRRKWIPTARPTPRPMSASAKPKRIPVEVPGAEWAGQDPFFPSRKPNKLTDSQWLHAQQLGPLQHGNVQKMSPSSTAPPRPKITPKSDRVIVLGKMSYEDTTWLEDELPEYAPMHRFNY